MASLGSRAAAALALSLALGPSTAHADDPPKAAPPAAGDAPPPPPPKPNVPSIGEVSVVVTGKLDPNKKAGGPAKVWRPRPKEVVRAGAVANAPSFQVLKDGGSRVQITVNSKVLVVEELAGPKEEPAAKVEKKEPKAAPKLPPAKGAKAKKVEKVPDSPKIFRATYRLKGATAPGKTNRLALPTDFFETTVERISLVDDGADALLVIDLRERVKPVFKQFEGERGLTVQIDLPRPTKTDAKKN